MNNWLRPRLYVVVVSGRVAYGSADRATIEQLVADELLTESDDDGLLLQESVLGQTGGPREPAREDFVDLATPRLWRRDSWRRARASWGSVYPPRKLRYKDLWHWYNWHFGRRIIVKES